MKKNFTINIDSLDILDAMDNEQAGRLFKAIRAYQNGQEHEVGADIKLAYFPFKNQFDKDAEAYKKIVERNRTNGSNGGRPIKPTGTQITQSVMVGSVKADNNIEARKKKFAETLKSFTETYGREMVLEFYRYWTEPNKSNTKFRMELERTWSLDRRLETWAKNNSSFNKGNTPQHKEVKYEQ
jgi:hypothetical protein